MPWRIDIPAPPPDALDRLVDLGALDLEEAATSGLAAILPDTVTPDRAAQTLGTVNIRASAAEPHDDGSVWLLSARPTRIGRLTIAPPDAAAAPNTLRIAADPKAFGTGHHPTTVLCLEALDELLAAHPPHTILDVGTGTGILALAALTLGVPKATALDTDRHALHAAAENARRNGLADRLELLEGGPEATGAVFPLVAANILTSPLLDMAPTLVRRLSSRGHLILSGIRDSLAADVVAAYTHLGLHHLETRTRDGWSMLLLQTSW